jgi:hypothetical protein
LEGKTTVALLAEKTVIAIDASDSRARTKTAGTKLSIAELAAFEAHCRRLDITPGELIRRLIMAELQRGTVPQKADPLLTEIVGVRLLLVNLLGPLASSQEPITKHRFESIVDEIKRVKHQVALDIQRQK